MPPLVAGNATFGDGDYRKFNVEEGRKEAENE